jgi:hypothetical protein
MIVTLVLMLVSGAEVHVDVEQEGCERTVQALRNGSRVVLRDNSGGEHEVEQARCVIDISAKEEPTS